MALYVCILRRLERVQSHARDAPSADADDVQGCRPERCRIRSHNRLIEPLPRGWLWLDAVPGSCASLLLLGAVGLLSVFLLLLLFGRFRALVSHDHTSRKYVSSIHDRHLFSDAVVVELVGNPDRLFDLLFVVGGKLAFFAFGFLFFFQLVLQESLPDVGTNTGAFATNWERDLSKVRRILVGLPNEDSKIALFVCHGRRGVLVAGAQELDQSLRDFRVNVS